MFSRDITSVSSGTLDIDIQGRENKSLVIAKSVSPITVYKKQATPLKRAL